MQTKRTGERFDLLAPDGSEIRLLVATSRGSMVHCSLPPGGASKAVTHRTVEEVWYFLEGQGQVWRKLSGDEQITDISAGVSLTIPLGAHFQFRNTGTGPLAFVIVTMPPWPSENEAVRVKDHWVAP